MRISRRALLRASATLAFVAPFGGNRALAAALPREADIVVIGAGAAGIAAARRIAAAGRRVLVLEATDRVGGRCHTDDTTFGVPFDRGARWLHGQDTNPVIRHARATGLGLVPAPQGQRIRIGRRNARAGEAETLLATLVRANRAIDNAARGRADVAAATVLPNDLAEWSGATRFVLGALRTTKDLDDLSVMDYARIQDRVTALACREGLGALIGRLAEGVPVALSTPAMQVSWGKRAASVETASGRVAARAVIVTVSTNVLQAGGMAFAPELPKRQLDALARLSLGSYDRIALELPGNPLGLGRDERVLEQSVDRETGLLLANIGGSSLCTVDIGGGFARDLGAQGEAAMVAFAVEWLVKLFGSDIKTKVGRSAATRWDAMPYIRGAASAAAPGGQPSRCVLMEPLQNLYFAGEACHETLWGTVGGAWESGERAAEAALKSLGPVEPPAKSKRPAKRRQ